MNKERFRVKNWPKFFWLILFYGLFRWLPRSGFPLLGVIAKYGRYFCCKHIFKYCGKNVNIEHGALFGCGFDIEIGDRSGIGINCVIPSNTKIGNNVNMGPNVYILERNHAFERTDIPMQEQGYMPAKRTTIGNDVWIGRQVIMTPGRTIADGTIIGAGCVLSKDFPPYSVVGGNPPYIIRNRLSK